MITASYQVKFHVWFTIRPHKVRNQRNTINSYFSVEEIFLKFTMKFMQIISTMNFLKSYQKCKNCSQAIFQDYSS